MFFGRCIEELPLSPPDYVFLITSKSDSIGGSNIRIEFERKEDYKPEISVDGYNLYAQLVNNSYIWQFYTTEYWDVNIEILYMGAVYNSWMSPLNRITIFKCNDSTAVETTYPHLGYFVCVPKTNSYRIDFYAWEPTWVSLSNIRLIKDTNIISYNNVELLGNYYTIIDSLQYDTIKFDISTKEIEEVNITKEFKIINRIGSETRKIIISAN